MISYCGCDTYLLPQNGFVQYYIIYIVNKYHCIFSLTYLILSHQWSCSGYKNGGYELGTTMDGPGSIHVNIHG
jgi:hypothetical protein